MSARTAADRFNPNTVLLTILLAISGWTLITLLDVKDTVTKTVVRVDFLSTEQATHTRAISDLQMRRALESSISSSVKP